MAIIDEIKDVLETVFDQKNLEINVETTSNDIEGWDSMSNVTMLLAVEDHFNIEFKPYEIAGLKNIGTLVLLVQTKLDQ